MKTIPIIVRKILFVVALSALSTVSLAADQVRGEFWEEVVCQGAEGDSEIIYLAGSYRILTLDVAAGDHTTWVFQIFWDADGYGTSSGAEYLLRGKWMEVIQDAPQYVLIWNDSFELVGKGKAENFRIYWKARVVTNARGEPIMDYFDALQCETIDFGIS